jgi:RNA polymerase sigma-70 factor (ECF subfamily)
MFGLDWLFCALSFVALGVFKGDNSHAAEDDPRQRALLERATQGDPAAIGELYDQYSGKIYNYIYHRVGSADLAEDLTGQVFMRMLEAIQAGRAWRTSFSGWLYRIAHNLVIDHYRRGRRATFVDIEDTTTLKATTGDPLRAVEARLNSERLRAALNQLTQEQAHVIVLRFLEEQSIAEVAAAMDKTEGAIKALQYRAVLALRRVMQK